MDLEPADPLLFDTSESESQTFGSIITWATGLGDGPRGLFWATLSPMFLGTVPILAKLAFAAGVDVRTVVAFGTLLAAVTLWLGILLFANHLIISSIPAISSSLLAGGINGIGSLFF